MTRVKILVALLAVLAPGAAFAQQPQTQTGSEARNQAGAQSASEPRISLQELIAEALANNPSIQSAERRVSALRARIPQVKTLPDPMVSLGWMGDVAPFKVQKGDPSSSRTISAAQEFPYPGKLKLRGQIVDRAAEASRWESEFVRRRVVADVKAAYYDYYYFDKAIEITLKNKDLLEKLAEIASVRYKVGQGIQQDILKAQVEVSRLEQRLTVLEQQKKTAQVRLNTLLYRQPEEPLGKPEPFDKAVFAYSIEELYQKAMDNDPELQRNERIIEQNQFAVNLAQKEYKPNFSVGFQYQNRPAMPEMYGAMVSLNIPVFYKTKQREGVREATEELISSQRGRDARKTTLFFELKEQYLAAKAADQLAALYSRSVVPQSTLALESSLASYQTGRVDFLTILSNFLTVLDYEIEYYREFANYQMALARMEPLVGVELTK